MNDDKLELHSTYTDRHTHKYITIKRSIYSHLLIFCWCATEFTLKSTVVDIIFRERHILSSMKIYNLWAFVIIFRRILCCNLRTKCYSILFTCIFMYHQKEKKVTEMKTENKTSFYSWSICLPFLSHHSFHSMCKRWKQSWFTILWLHFVLCLCSLFISFGFHFFFGSFFRERKMQFYDHF